MLPILLTMSLLCADTSTLQPGDHTIEVIIDGTTRSAIVHVPASYDANHPSPLVLCFHGGGSNAHQQVSYTGLNEKSDEAGFLAVYPDGSGRLAGIRTWNAGNCCGYAQRQDIDEIAFVTALLDELEIRANVDQRRIYATGISNGGMLAYQLASEMSDRIAAIASIAGPMGDETCSPRRPVPVLHFHGTEDEFVSIDGGPGSRSLSQTDFYSLEHTLNAWVAANGCSTKAEVTLMPDRSDDGMTVERHEYGNGREGSEVVFYKIIGGGHTWPGRQLRIKLLGPSTLDISANDLIWEFFDKHPMP
ncbi:MAG: PHB depolymerase family esterase [Planctomycetaceae bacterium]